MTLADEVKALNNLRHDDIHSGGLCVLCDKSLSLARKVRELEEEVAILQHDHKVEARRDGR